MEDKLRLFWRTAVYQEWISGKDHSLAISTWEMVLWCFTRKRTETSSFVYKQKSAITKTQQFFKGVVFSWIKGLEAALKLWYIPLGGLKQMFSLFQWPVSDVSKEDTKNVSGMVLEEILLAAYRLEQKLKSNNLRIRIWSHLCWRKTMGRPMEPV